MQSFKKHIASFSAKLSNIDAASITTDAYAKLYLQELLLHKTHYLHLYALVLDKIFAATDKQPNEIALLDFGTGNGLFALFVKHCGVKEVYASDISASFLQAAQQLSKALSIELNGWIVGDENVLLHYFSNKKLDVFAGTDVIEHVYDLDNLFTVIKQLNPAMITAFTTASVTENPFKSAKLQALQRKDELESSNSLHAVAGNTYSGLSFLETRKRMIATKFPDLNKQVIEVLAKLTRGLREDDIYKAVEVYQNTNKLPVEITNLTNTCDPINGSWTERLLSIDEYEKLYSKYGFYIHVYNGFYNAYEQNIKSIFSSILNVLVSIIGKKIAPFIIIIGKS